MDKLNVSLEQWQVLQAVADEGSFQAAADKLHKSQSTVSYSLQKLQENLGIQLFEYQGRRAQLTEAGLLILRRARTLLEQAGKLERAAKDLAAGWEPQINLLVDVIFPESVLLQALAAFAPQSRGTHVEVFSESLSGSQDMIVKRQVELGIVAFIPPGFLGQRLLEVEFIAVAAADHPLHQLDTPIKEETLRLHRQIVVRDSGTYRRSNAGWLGAEERWTVNDFKDSISYIKHGLGFAFLPRHYVTSELASGELKPLQLEMGGMRSILANLVYTDKSSAGPATQLLAAELIRASGSYK